MATDTPERRPTPEPPDPRGLGRGFQRVAAWLEQSVDPLPLVVYRVGFGALMLFSAIRFMAKGWVETHYLQPDFHFRYLFFDWVHPLPGNGLYLVFGVQIACAAMVALGWRYRLAAVGFFFSFTYVELLDQTTYLNHYYFISLASFLLIFLPLHRWGSLDARRNPELGRVGPGRWIPVALQLQIGMVYFFAGLAKINPDWLLEAQPLRIWLAARAGFPVVGVLFDQEWFAYLMSWAGAVFDLTIPFLLAWRRSRPPAYLAVVAFHLATGLLFPIGVFPWVMIGATLVFFEGRELRRAIAWLGRTVRLLRPLRPARDGESPRPNSAAPGSSAARPSAAMTVFLVGFFLLQIAMPLRHLAYPGPVLWTEEGYRFSWRVMLAEKTGTAFYRLRDPSTDRSWEIVPGEHLTPRQEQQFAFQPDMILGFAHHLRDLYRTDEGIEPEIRVQAYVSLNGRRSRLLVDPAVDLASVPRGLGPKRWLLPVETLPDPAAPMSMRGGTLAAP